MYTNNTTSQLTFSIDIEETSVSSRKKKLTFQPYTNQQIMMIPDLESFIPAHHIARIIDEFVESIPTEVLIAHYDSGGRAPYHPKLMLKIILYGYTQKVYSSRRIAQMVRENIPMMWLAGMQQPDHRTINEFRGERMPEILDDVFEQLLLQLIDAKLIDLEHIFVDGTKIEANANKYSFVWKKAVNNFDEKLHAKAKALVAEIRAITESETEPLTLEEQLMKTAVQLLTEVEDLEESIASETDKEKKKELKKLKTVKKNQAKTIEEDYLPRLKKYEKHREILGERNSYSKTDNDATFMRLKDDHMKNGQLKAAYNIQLATQNQYIVGFDIFQRPGDTLCFQPFMEKLLNRRYLPSPSIVVADAGYASEQNYLYSIGEEKEPRFQMLVPYSTYVKEKTRKFKKDIKQAKNWTYLEEEDCYICPNNRRVEFQFYRTRKDKDGFKRDFKIYECEDCSDCPLKELCTKAKGNRQVHYNPVYEEMKGKAKTALEDETLAALYAQRKTDVESAFGNLKGNLSFTRFLLRGLQKVRTEFGLVAMAHNLRKLAGHRLAISLKSANFTFFSFYRKTFINQITRKGVPRKVHYGLFRHPPVKRSTLNFS